MYADLKKVIADAPRNQTGQLITPIKITANIVSSSDPSRHAQLKGRKIILRPIFVSKLQDYCKGADYIEGLDPKIKYFKRGFVSSSSKPKTIPPNSGTSSQGSKISNTMMIHALKILESSLHTLSLAP